MEDNNNPIIINNDGNSNSQLVIYEFINTNSLNRFMSDYKNLQIILHDLRNGNFCIIDLKGNNCITFNLYSNNIWIKESFIFCNFWEKIRNIKFKYSEIFEIFLDMKKYNLKSFKFKSAFKEVCGIYIRRNRNANLNVENIKLFWKIKSKLRLINFHIDFYQLLNQNYDFRYESQIYILFKKIDELCDKVINAFPNDFTGEELSRNNLLPDKKNNIHSLKEKESSNRKSKLNDNRIKCIDSDFSNYNIMAGFSSESLFEERQENEEKERSPLVENLRDFIIINHMEKDKDK